MKGQAQGFFPRLRLVCVSTSKLKLGSGWEKMSSFHLLVGGSVNEVSEGQRHQSRNPQSFSNRLVQPQSYLKSRLSVLQLWSSSLSASEGLKSFFFIIWALILRPISITNLIRKTSLELERAKTRARRPWFNAGPTVHKPKAWTKFSTKSDKAQN